MKLAKRQTGMYSVYSELHYFNPAFKFILRKGYIYNFYIIKVRKDRREN